MQQSLSALSQIYVDDPVFTLNLELYANCGKLFGSQAVLIETMLNALKKQVEDHFKYQLSLMQLTVRPFLNKIDGASSKHEDMLAKYLKKRESLQNNSSLKEKQTVQYRLKLDYLLQQIKVRRDANDAAGEQLAREELTRTLYFLLTTLETQLMDRESKQLDRQESVLMYTHNQFLRCFKHLINEVEMPVTRYQMSQVGEVFEQCLNRLNCEWSDFVDIRIRKIHDTHLGKASRHNKSEMFSKFIEDLQRFENERINREIQKLQQHAEF